MTKNKNDKKKKKIFSTVKNIKKTKKKSSSLIKLSNYLQNKKKKNNDKKKNLIGNKYKCTNNFLSRITTTNKLIDNYIKFVEKDDVAIIGISGAFSGVNSIEDMWKAVLDGKELFENCTQNLKKKFFYSCNKNSFNNSNDKLKKKFIPVSGIVKETDKFDVNLFNLSREDISELDPQIRLSILHAYSALEKSGYIKKRNKLRIGCFIGAEPSEFIESKKKNQNCGDLKNMFWSNQKDFIAMWISYVLNLTGPSSGVYSACSSSLLAIKQAIHFLLQNETNLCLVGGVHLIAQNNIGHDYVPGMVFSPNSHSRPFTHTKNSGIVRGSGVSIAVLKQAMKAIKDKDNILGIIKSCYINNDGGMCNKSNFMAPSYLGQYKTMSETFKKTFIVKPQDIDYLECHATGTCVGDAVELKAINKVYTSLKNFHNKKLYIGSIKANIGHTFAASGMASLTKCLKILETKKIPTQLKTLDNTNIKKKSEFIKISFEIEPKQIKHSSKKPIFVAFNNFGIGGTNGSVILMEGIQRFKKNLNKTSFLKNKSVNVSIFKNTDYSFLTISGASKNSCLLNCKKIAKYIEEKTENICEKKIKKILKNIAFTLQFHREHHKFRICIITNSKKDAITKLNSATINDIIESKKRLENSLAMFFCPQGVQYPQMLKYEIQHSSFFKKNINLYASYFKKNKDIFKNILNSDNVNNVKFTQCILFSVCKTISNSIKEIIDSKYFGTYFGHSLGEYVALTEANVLNEKNCFKLLAARGRLIEKLVLLNFY